MRLIDADELLNLFAEEFKRTKQLIADGETHLDSLAEGYTEAAHVAKYLAPTVDATPVVRCRECKNWKTYGSNAARNVGDTLERYGECEICGVVRLESDFCSFGRTREVEE